MQELNLGQAAKIADCSRDTIRRAAQRQELPARLAPGKRGRQWMVRQADLMDWLRERHGEAGAVSAAPGPDERDVDWEREARTYRRRAQQAEHALSALREELSLARRAAEEAEERLKTARGLLTLPEERQSLWNGLKSFSFW